MARYQFKRSVNIDSVDDVKAFIDRARANDASKSNVVKIVIGPSPGGSTEGWDSQELARLADVEWYSFPNLTHLYLWSIAGLKRIGPLPANLECLDLRGCHDLETLPADLPSALETLDLEGCAKLTALPDRLPTSLVEIYLQDCAKLRKFAPVRALLNHRLRREGKPGDAATGHGTEQRGLRRLVMHGCGFEDLDKSFRGDHGENRAGDLVRIVREQRAQNTARIAECKLVVLGDGGAGKTSLIRALKGHPFEDQPATDRIRCWSWDGGDDFRPFQDHPDVKATINVWDFAGQQLYHSTHRMFLESRAVFLVVWRTPPADGGPNRQECPDDKRQDLNYWLDQIHAVNDDPAVVIVRTRCDEDRVNEPDVNWRKKLRPQYRHLADSSAFTVSARDSDISGKWRETLTPLRKKLQEEIRKQIPTSDSVTVAKGWKAVRDRLATMQPKWEDTASDQRRDPNDNSPIMRLGEFSDLVEEVYRDIDGANHSADGVSDILRFFHDIGAVYCPRAWRQAWDDIPQPQVIIDQEWAIEAVYRLTTDKGAVSELRARKGYVSRTALDDLWAAVTVGRSGPGAGDGIEPLTTDPGQLWAVEQMMLAAGIMVEVPMKMSADQQFVFPDYLPDRASVEALLVADQRGETSRLLQTAHDTFTVTRGRKAAVRTTFDYSFATHLMSRVQFADDRAVLFRYGAVLFVEFATRDDHAGARSVRPAVVVIEWQPPRSDSVATLTFSVYCEPSDQVDRGELGWRVIERWVAAGVAVGSERSKLGYVGRRAVSKARASETDGPEFQLPEGRSKSVIDVAISYASKDDPVHNHFPELLREDLVKAMQASGFNESSWRLQMYADGGGRSVSEIVSAVSQSAIVIALLSHRYFASMWCMQELYMCALSDTGRDHLTITQEESNRVFPMGGAPAWRERLIVLRLPVESRGREADFEYVYDESCSVVSSERKDLSVTAVHWANQMCRRAKERYEHLANLHTFPATEPIYRSMAADSDGGKWAVVIHKIGHDPVASVRRCVLDQTVVAFDRLSPSASLEEKSRLLAADVAQRCANLRERQTDSWRKEYFKETAIAALQGGRVDRAVQLLQKLIELSSIRPGDVVEKHAYELFGDPSLEPARLEWVKARSRAKAAKKVQEADDDRPTRR